MELILKWYELSKPTKSQWYPLVTLCCDSNGQIYKTHIAQTFDLDIKETCRHKGHHFEVWNRQIERAHIGNDVKWNEVKWNKMKWNGMT